MRKSLGYSGIIIENVNGKFLFQLRDNKKNIANPNKWGLFGGGIKAEETPIEAVVREVKEELNINLSKKDVKLFLRKRNKNINIFYARISRNQEKEIKLGEGRDFKFMNLFQFFLKKNAIFNLKIIMVAFKIKKLFGKI